MLMLRGLNSDPGNTDSTSDATVTCHNFLFATMALPFAPPSPLQQDMKGKFALYHLPGYNLLLSQIRTVLISFEKNLAST